MFFEALRVNVVKFDLDSFIGLICFWIFFNCFFLILDLNLSVLDVLRGRGVLIQVECVCVILVQDFFVNTLSNPTNRCKVFVFHFISYWPPRSRWCVFGFTKWKVIRDWCLNNNWTGECLVVKCGREQETFDLRIF